MLKACSDLLADNGDFYLRANLHRGATASHRYREMFFPWPHLLFDESVFYEFYEHKGLRQRGPSWVNKLTFAQYLHYFQKLNLNVEQQWLSQHPLDEEFYDRFEEDLSRYPTFDLVTEFFDVKLKKTSVAQEQTSPGQLEPNPHTELEDLTRHLKAETRRNRDFLREAAKRLPISRPMDETTAEEVLDLLNSRFYRAAGKTYRFIRHVAHSLRGNKSSAKNSPGQK